MGEIYMFVSLPSSSVLRYGICNWWPEMIEEVERISKVIWIVV